MIVRLDDAARDDGVAGAGVALDEAPGFRETLQPRPPRRKHYRAPGDEDL